MGVPRNEVEGAEVERRRRQVVDLPWTFLRQVHGPGVVMLEHAGAALGVEGDALVTAATDTPLAVFTADCAPLALASPEGIIGVAHAGWRGLATGVVAATVEAMRAQGATCVEAALGPCIRAGCYEFGPEDLETVVEALGDRVRATTVWGSTSLDLAGAARCALDALGVGLVVDLGACTACSPVWFSHRARADTARQATVVWIPDSRP